MAYGNGYSTGYSDGGPVDLAGTTGGTSTAGGSLSVHHPLAGSSAGTSTLTADLTNTKDLVGSSAGSSTLTAALTVVAGDDVLNPRADVAINSWTTDTGATTNLYQAIDEGTASDADYVQSPLGPTTSQYYEAQLETRPDPLLSTGHIAHYRYQRSGTEAIDLTASLYQGSTLIKSWVHTSITTSWVTADQTLSGVEADSITNYDDLRLRFTPNQPGSGAGSERMPPDALTVQTDLSGTVADIDEDPDAAGIDWLTASDNNVDTIAHVTFGTPTGTLALGADLQEFRVLVRKSVTSGTGTPTVQIHLYENGSLISSGTSTNVTSSVGQVVAYTWDATGRTASLIECRVVGTKSGGSPSARSSVDVGAVEWNAATAVLSRAQVSWANFEIPTVGAGVPQALAGTTGGTSTVAGTLSANRSLVGSSAGTSTAAGTLSVSHTLIGATNGSSTASGTLGVHHPLAGSSAGSSTAAGTLGNKASLTGSSAGSSTVAANVKVHHPLAGTTGGTSSTTASLFASGGLVGASAGDSTVSGSLSLSGALSGSTGALSETVADLSVHHPLAGTTAGSSTVVGAMDVGGSDELIGSTSGESTVSGTLSVGIPIAGTSSGSSVVSGDLTVVLPTQLEGTTAGRSTLSGHLIVAISLEGTTGAFGRIQGDLTDAARIYTFRLPTAFTGAQVSNNPSDRPLNQTMGEWLVARRLFRYYGPREVGRSVLKIDDEYVVFETPSQEDIARATEVYLGGHEYHPDEATANALIAAGYDVT